MMASGLKKTILRRKWYRHENEAFILVLMFLAPQSRFQNYRLMHEY